MKKLIYLFAFLNCIINLSATNVDSLKNVLLTVKSDSLKIDALNNLSIYFEFIADYKKAEYYHNERLNLLARSPNIKAQGDVYNYYGRKHFYKQLYDSSLYYFEKSIIFYQRANYIKGLISARNNIAAINSQKGYIRSSIAQHYKLIEINNNNKKDKNMFASSYSNLGYCFMEISLYDSALYYFTKAVKINSSINDLTSLSSNYYNLATINSNVGNYEKAFYYLDEIEKKDLPKKLNVGSLILCLKSTIYEKQNNIDSLKKYVLLAKNKCLEEGDNFTLLSVLINEYKYNIKIKNYTLAENILKEGLSLTKKISANSFLTKFLGYFGELYVLQNNNKEALKFYDEALIESLKYNGYFEFSSLIKTTADLNSKLGNFEKSSMLYDSLIKANERFNVIELQKRTKEVEEQYLSEKKDAQIKQQEMDIEQQHKQNKIQKTVLIIGAIFVVLISLLGLIAFKNYKKSKAQNLIIEKQKSEVIEKQNEIIASINYAKRIQNAHLPTNAQITKMINSNNTNP